MEVPQRTVTSVQIVNSSPWSDDVESMMRCDTEFLGPSENTNVCDHSGLAGINSSQLYWTISLLSLKVI